MYSKVSSAFTNSVNSRCCKFQTPQVYLKKMQITLDKGTLNSDFCPINWPSHFDNNALCRRNAKHFTVENFIID